MAKVFRTHNSGTDQADWFNSQQIGPDVIDHINVMDMQGTKQPSSIPTPFARIDLVRNAFQRVTSPNNQNNVNLSGNSDAHQLVSDALDIGQLFFNLNNYEHLSVSRWNKTQELQNLRQSQSPFHQHLGETLDLFLTQDGTQYNFNLMNDLFILKYKNQVIGGTSPRTLFFAASRASAIELFIDGDQMLDNKPRALHERSKDYILYLFGLSRSFPHFANLFPEFNKYLNETLIHINRNNIDFANQINAEALSEYDKLITQTLPNFPGISINVLDGLVLKSAPELAFQSDFEIISSKDIQGKKPLVLPFEVFAQNWTYVQEKWDSQTEVPCHDSTPLTQRRLPRQGTQYPYLTQNDFLTPTLIRLPYQIDHSKFFTAGDKRFLLPLTPQFFEYFSVRDIGNSVKISIEESPYEGIFRVRMEVPTRRGSIVYDKKYKVNTLAYQTASNQDKEGVIVDLRFSLGIYPFVFSEIDDNLNIEYNIGLLDFDSSKTSLNIKPKSSISFSNEIAVNRDRRANIITDSNKRISDHYSFSSKFDLIEFHFGNTISYLIPKLHKHINGGSNYQFAIDFGTTKTHIEYKIAAINPFEIQKDESQIALLRDLNAQMALRFENTQIEEAEEYLIQEMIPLKIGIEDSRKFPIRTCVLENVSISYDQRNTVFSHVNIGFDYEYKDIKSYLKPQTELKWNDLKHLQNRERIQRFLEQALSMCKHKVLMNDGNYSNTTITWMYPTSMTGNHFNLLSGIWSKAFDKVFANNLSRDSLKQTTESIAPFYYYSQNEGIMAHAAPVVSIDIGGGTTDVVLFKGREAKFLTSFRYAGNAIFGDGINSNPNLNGFVKLYQNKFSELLTSNGLSEEKKVLDKILIYNNRSTDLINFLFSLSENRNVIAKKAPISLNDELIHNEDLRIVFIHFFGSLIFHVAQLTHALGYEKPGMILLSGTGAKSLNILNGGVHSLSSIERFFGKLFDSLYPSEAREIKLKIKLDQNPKEISARGALYSDGMLLDRNNLIATHAGGKGEFVIHNNFTLDKQQFTFKNITDSQLNSVVENVQDYFDLINKLNQQNSIYNGFGITPKSISALSNCILDRDYLMNLVIEGKEMQRNEAGTDEEKLEETLFFYPFIGVLNKLAYEIALMTENDD